MNWISSTEDGVLINVRVVPRASKNEIVGVRDNALRIRLQTPPIEGRANRKLVRLLATTLDIPRNRISIVSGDKSRNKRVLVKDLNEREVGKKLRNSRRSETAATD
jgi:uncharacterized protein (TIGR00251 family)